MKRFSSGSGLFLIFLASIFHFHPLAGQTKRALVVAIGDYRDSRNWKHISSIEDLVYIRAGLEKFGFTTDHIDTLKNEQATRIAILNALDKLASTSGAGDNVVFFFCGHGQQIMDNNGKPDEADGYDESLVTYNAAGRYNPTGDTGQNHLRDDELGQKLSAISEVSKSADIFLEASATEAQAKKSLVTNKYVHFATYGTLNYTQPTLSYLTFSRNPNDDGRLTISEIDSMEVRNNYYELVTLSSCETAKPLEISKDWVVSPANSFLRKKFKSVVASLWKVNDEATGILMTEFYKNLASMDNVHALRMAQIKLSKDVRYQYPFYWGGFVLYGDCR